ncbi:GTP cyclohydrolase II [Cryobacterium serini]|uniref:GTP cyclohydrolase-2 n=1 Tax=Cryobacterium serini TaxID=1259201 RepID=A0A4R9BIM0_9MICO|nr:GTP cyclohydrolase II [Cryobacterium serini]
MAETCFSTNSSRAPTPALSAEEDSIRAVRAIAMSGVRFEVETTVPTKHGTFQFRAYRDLVTGSEHLAIVSGRPTDGCLVRVHSECLTGEVFKSQKCECGPQLDSALNTINQYGGIVIYMRGHEGRGIGLVNKLKAYRLQEAGLDTLDANLALGLPADGRDYSAAAAILHNLQLQAVRLLTNNPDKVDQLTEHGITVLERIPLTAGAHPANSAYLRTKRDRMGHLLQHAL